MNMLRKISAIAQFILVVIVLTFPAHAAGEVDTSFLANLNGLPSGTINKILVQPDGKALIGGNFRFAASYARSGLFRLNADGTVDTNFQPPSFFNSSGIGGTINEIGLQSDGKILVGGNFQGANGVPNPGLMRLNTDGSIDPTFNAQLNSSGTILDIIVLPDDRIIIAGNFTIIDSGGNRIGIARLNSNGSLDSIVYQTIVAISDVLVLPDGRLIAGNAANIRRFNTDGTFDPTFISATVSGGFSGVEDMKSLPDGKIIVAGGFTMVNGSSRIGLFRINSDGSFDTTFYSGGTGPNFYVFGITPTPAGKYLISGSFTTYNGVSRKSVALIDENGLLDTSFNYTVSAFRLIYSTAFLPDGKILVGGTAESSPQQNALARINADGSLDNSVNLLIGSSAGPAYTILVQPDGKIIVGGQFSFANGVSRNSLARFNPDGSLDTTFTPPNFGISGAIFNLALQPDGKILVPFLLSTSSRLYRLNANGTVDFSIQISYANDTAYLPDGKFLVVDENRLRRYNPNGSQDTSFTSASTSNANQIYKIAVQPDGKIIVAGTFTTIGGQTRGRVARLNADGTLDTTFNPPGGANGNIHNVAVQTDGKILIGGVFTGVNFNTTKQYLARLNSDGSLDTGFSPVLNAPVLGFKIQPDGKILIGGAMSTVNGASRSGIARINPDGSLDTSFNVGSGTNSTVWSIDLQNDKIVYAGQFTATNGFSTLGVGRLLNDPVSATTLFDYDGDGKADISVYRPSTNRWYELLSSNSSVFEATFGIAEDIVTPADFDGDGKTDIAVFRPSSGSWWYLSSVDNTQRSVQFGAAGDIPRPSDFDGDGVADYIVFRPSNNAWYRLGSTGVVDIDVFGTSGDKPVTGDFDGDGKSDIAIFRPSTGTWWYQSSLNNAQLATGFGAAEDKPVPADYDGDGKTDLAVFRPSTGVWYILNSSSGQATIVGFGLAEDKPIAADYDGDGKADIAVFRPSTGVWYLLRSTAGFAALQFGISTDIPTQNAFVQ